jgi:TRAP-type C4-dicarboxylate transport system permease small subunit
LIRKLYDRLIAAEALVAAALLVVMVALIFAGGVSRVLGYPLNWSTDFATASFAWACFLCADVAWRKNSLMSIELVVSRLPDRLQKACRMANYAIISAFLVYAIVFGSWLAWTSRVRSFQGMPEISYSWVTMSMPIGAALLLVTTILKVRDEMRGIAHTSHAVDVT